MLPQAGMRGTRHLLWTRGDELVAQRFDLDAAALVGDAQTVVRGPFAGIVGRSFSRSRTKARWLLRRRPAGYPADVVLTRKGQAVSNFRRRTHMPTNVNGTEMSLSPDAKRVVVTGGGGVLSDVNLWLVDLDRGGASYD